MCFCETSLEYDLFEEMRRKLSRLLAEGGRDPVEADRISLYVMQGLRDVPRLLNALASDNTPDAETRELLGFVLEGATSLDRARAVLLGHEELHAHRG